MAETLEHPFADTRLNDHRHAVIANRDGYLASGSSHLIWMICTADGEGFDSISVTALPANSLAKPADSSAAKSGAVSSMPWVEDADLAMVVDAWPKLPSSLRQLIAELARECGGKRDIACDLPHQIR